MPVTCLRATAWGTDGRRAAFGQGERKSPAPAGSLREGGGGTLPPGPFRAYRHCAKHGARRDARDRLARDRRCARGGQGGQHWLGRPAKVRKSPPPPVSPGPWGNGEQALSLRLSRSRCALPLAIRRAEKLKQCDGASQGHRACYAPYRSDCLLRRAPAEVSAVTVGKGGRG